MNQTYSEIKVVLIVILLGIVGIAGYTMGNRSVDPIQPVEVTLSGQGGIGANACTISSQTTVAIGDELSTQLLATSSRRAWAYIELPVDLTGVATNTISLGYGVTATLALSGDLSTTTPSREIGLNTNFAFTGAIHAITSTGSTTAKVVECTY